MHNVTVGPVADTCASREMVTAGHKRIQPLESETFDMTYPKWVMEGYKKKVTLAHHAELEQRIRRVNPAVPPPCG